MRVVKIIFTLLFISFLTPCASFNLNSDNIIKSIRNDSVQIYTSPKLVVGIVVDQMRYDYLTRFWDRYGEDGFKRLVSGGYLLKNTHYNYVPTFTAPGHSSIYTGTSPRYHGIISNSWYNKNNGHYDYCVADSTVTPVGTESSAGKMSPQQLLATTVTDQNRLATQFRGKTIGIALKDRAAILPAGHAANAAYWFHGNKKEGRFITSSYYREKLPRWVKKFNTSGKAKSYLKKWNTLYPISTYKESGEDLNDFEGKFKGKDEATFPYDLEELSEKHYGYGMIFSTPFGNNLTTDFALASIDGEDLGQDADTDFLTISYSSPDYIGHKFGVNSKETEDNYLRLDKQIARLLKALDQKVGKGNYTVFLTADHGGINVPAYLKSKKINAGYFSHSKLRKNLKDYVEKTYKTKNVIAKIKHQRVFFDKAVLKENDIDFDEITRATQDFLMEYPKIAQVYTREMLEGSSFTGMVAKRIKNGYNPKRSGDVIYSLQPGYISYSRHGSQHGSAYKYDTHVPLIFYGKGINKGQTTKKAKTVDIAPTISALLGIAFPNAATGEVLYEVIDD